jgi:hypothetical protein
MPRRIGVLSRGNNLRTTLAFAAVVVLVWAVGYVLVRMAGTPPDIGKSESPEKHSQRFEALKMRAELSGKMFDVTVIFLGVVWGLILAGSVPTGFTRWQDDTMFISSNLMLLFSLFCHFQYKNRIATLLWDLAPNQPDISGGSVHHLLFAQWVTFLCGLFVGLLTIISEKVIT